MATLFDSASLVMIPSGVKEDKLYSIKPTDGSGDFTFSRGSDIQATRVNSSGLIEKAKENLLLQSNSFGTTWINSGTTETGGQTGYDGSSDAWLLTATTTAGNYIQQNISFSGVHTYSVYLKANTATFSVITIEGTGGGFAYFNLSGGSVGTTNNVIDTSIESIGSGWYRCSIVLTPSAGTAVRIYPTDGDNATTIVAGHSIYIQDAQLNHGLIAQDYVETTTTAVVEGLTADLPRLDYSGGASCPSLLLEPSRTNNIPQSEYFGSGSGWNLLNNVTIGDFVLSPEGKMNATELIFDGTTSGRIERAITGLTSGADYSVSLYARVASGTQNVFFGSFESSVFTLTTEWQRLEKTQPENDTTAYPRITCDDAATIEIYAFQHEAGSYPTSYIPTYGTAANRGADVCSKENIAGTLPTAYPFTLYAEGFLREDNEVLLGVIDISASDIYYHIGATANGFFATARNGATSIAITGSGRSVGTHKVAAVFTSSEIKLFANGALIATGANAQTFNATANDVLLGQLRVNSDLGKRSSVNQALVFKTALTDAECIALTTI